MIARSCKHQIRGCWRQLFKAQKVPRYSRLIEMAAMFLSAVAGSSSNSYDFYEKIIKVDLTRRFEFALTESEFSKDFDLKDFIVRSGKIPALVQRIADLTGISLRPSFLKDLETYNSIEVLYDGRIFFKDSSILDIIAITGTARSADFAQYYNAQETLQKIRASPPSSTRKRLIAKCIDEMEPITTCNKPEMLLGLAWLYLQSMKDGITELKIEKVCLLGGVASVSRSSGLRHR
jgi:hypothetical protein